MCFPPSSAGKGFASAYRHPCLPFPRSAPPLLRLRSLGVAFGLPLGSKRRRGSLRLKTLASSPHAVPPVPAFSPLPLQRRGLSLAPFGRWRSGGGVPAPPLRGCVPAGTLRKEHHRGTETAFLSLFINSPFRSPQIEGKTQGSVNRASLSVSNLTDSKFILDFFCNL